MKKIIALFLIFSLVAISCRTITPTKTGRRIEYKEREHGVHLIIQKTDGEQIGGELIAVKQNSLLIVDSGTSADMSVDIKEINWIKFEKKLKGLKAGIGAIGMGFFGLVFGIPVGVIAALVIKPDDAMEAMGIIGISSLVVGGLGAIYGGITGGSAETIKIKGKSDSEIKEILEYLRTKARSPDYK